MAPRIVARTGGDVGDWVVRLSPALPFYGRLTRPNDRPAGGVRLRFEPLIHQTGFVERVASTLPLIDEEVVTDSHGDFVCRSLLSGDYKVRLADEPKTPALLLRAEEVRAGSATLRVLW